MTADLQGEFERESGVNVRELRGQVDREIAGIKGELAGVNSTLQKEANYVKKTAQSATPLDQQVRAARRQPPQQKSPRRRPRQHPQ